MQRGPAPDGDLSLPPIKGLKSHRQTSRDLNRVRRDAQGRPERGSGPRRRSVSILRKEVIQPQVPLRLPCYDFTPVADLTVVGCLLAVSAPA